MLLKRVYDKTDPANPKVNGVRVLRAGGDKNFSPDLINDGLAQGWLSMSKGKLVLEGENAVITYAIRRAPGYYCCHCGEALVDAGNFVAPGVTVGMKHVADTHSDTPSPDESNPAGYEKINHFDCEQLKVEEK